MSWENSWLTLTLLYHELILSFILILCDLSNPWPLLSTTSIPPLHKTKVKKPFDTKWKSQCAFGFHLAFIKLMRAFFVDQMPTNLQIITWSFMCWILTLSFFTFWSQMEVTMCLWFPLGIYPTDEGFLCWLNAKEFTNHQVVLHVLNSLIESMC